MKLPLTYRSALKLLGADEPALLRSLDTLLGGIILTSGAVGFPVGSAVLTAVWGWIDQKSEFVQLLTKGVTYARRRLSATSGYERSQLIAAAHTAIVGEALFHGLQQHLGPAYRALKLTDQEKRSLFTDADATHEYRNAIESLIETSVDIPWAGCAFDDNLATNVTPYLRAGVERCLASFEKLAVWDRAWRELGWRPTTNDILNAAVVRYEENYFRLASDVPEFLVWAILGGQRAENRAIRTAGREVAGALKSEAKALHRVEAVLALISHSTGPDRDRMALEKANRAILDQPLIKLSEMDHTVEVSIPSIKVGYVVPRFRFAVTDGDSQPSSEEWWESRRVRSDLDEFLVAYLTSARSTQQPLVVLGHPGAGKSLLARVLTARLSATAFPAFLVPLRRVREPSAPIYQQVQQMLDESTHARAVWSRIADATPGDPNRTGATRVVLLDGLDELMQATGTTQSGYLSQVQEFQRIESTQDAPLAVIVTSRQIVADIANIPSGCAVLRLEDFTDPQISEWIDAWNRTNPANGRGGSPPLSLHSMTKVGAIVRQPLLLLMIAIQATASGAFATAGNEVTVYQQLLADFTRRELRKSAVDDFAIEPPSDSMVNGELWRLGIAAYGMFNRGRQFVTEEQLQSDLVSLDPRGRPGSDGRAAFVRPLSDARRTIGRFFFIHTSEAGEDQNRRVYEFLHATFSEYLIAYHAVDRMSELIDSYQAYVAGRLRPGIAWDDDEVLYSLLSHRPIAVGGAVLQFTQQIFDSLDTGARATGGEVLEKLMTNADRHRATGRETAYNPGSRSTVQRLAAYLTNLVLLRLSLLPERSIGLKDLAPADENPTSWWRSIVRLMQAGLDEATWQEVLQTIEPFVSGEGHGLKLRRLGLQDGAREVHEARLLFDEGSAEVAYVGVTLWRGIRVPDTNNPAHVYSDVVARRLFATPAPGSAQSLVADIRQLGRLEAPVSLAVVEYLLTHCAHLSLEETTVLAEAAVTSATIAVRAVPLVVLWPDLLRLLPQFDTWYGRRFSSTAEFARVGSAFALLNLIGSDEEKNRTWPLYKVIMRTNADLAPIVSPQRVKKYAAVATVADFPRALMPALLDALTYDLVSQVSTDVPAGRHSR